LRSLLILLLAATAALAIACTTIDEDGPLLPAAGPTLALPSLDAGLRSVGDGSLRMNVGAGSRQDIDPLDLAQQAGTPPACADFVFVFSWQVDGQGTLTFVGNRQGGEFDIASGSQGRSSSSGCILLQAQNSGGSTVRGEMRYIIASARP
jgi:hypothetical protein